MALVGCFSLSLLENHRLQIPHQALRCSQTTFRHKQKKEPQKHRVLGHPLTPRRCPTATERPMERAGEPRLSSRRSSVEAKTHRTSWKVRNSSTVTACPVVVSLCSWKGEEKQVPGLSSVSGWEIWSTNPKSPKEMGDFWHQ